MVARAEQVHGIRRVAFETDGRGADAAVADDNGGDALRDFGEQFGRVDHTGVVVGVNIDEAWGEREAFGFDGACGGTAERCADRNYATVTDGEIEELRVAAGPIEHVGTADEGVAIHAD
jgi:hypothetical protein